METTSTLQAASPSPFVGGRNIFGGSGTTSVNKNEIDQRMAFSFGSEGSTSNSGFSFSRMCMVRARFRSRHGSPGHAIVDAAPLKSLMQSGSSFRKSKFNALCTFDN